MSSGKILNNYQFKMSNEFDLSSDFIYKEENLISNPLVLDPNINCLENILYRIIEIHFLLKNNSKLSNNQRLDYCKVERNLMIQYLKQVVRKV
ncbi:MAG: hypothetical protein ACXACC_08210 [Promethearchaeota archaeon]|jgi:hypothetical protein